jgi:HPt (histidine-containing phosphotransfer) domain-containing protein
MTPWDKQEILDLGLLIEAFGSIDEEAKSVLGLFLTSTRPLLESIPAALLSGDLAGAAASAHAAKGAANMTGAFRLGSLCAEVCRLLTLGDAAQAQNASAHIPVAFGEVQAAIDQVRK